jgi:hypothetical protein
MMTEVTLKITLHDPCDCDICKDKPIDQRVMNPPTFEVEPKDWYKLSNHHKAQAGLVMKHLGDELIERGLYR